MTLYGIIHKFEGLRNTGKNRWQARCPAHDDNDPSLSITVTDNGNGEKVLLHCHAGCQFEEILDAAGIKAEDLFLDKHEMSEAEKDALEKTMKRLEREAGISGNGITPEGLRLKPVKASELPDSEDIESLWGDLLYPGCITQLNSEPGTGKSTIAYNLCAFGALNKPFLGVEFSQKVKPLDVDVETPKALRKRKIQTICETLPDDFHLLDSLDIRKDFKDLLRLCEIEKYDLLVLDTQSRTFGMEKENDNSEANEIMGLLRELANRTGVAILLIHHTTKGDSNQNVYRGRGASAVAAAVDVVANLEALDDEILKLTIVKNRIMGSHPSQFIRKAGEDHFEPHIPQGECETGFEVFKIQDLILKLDSTRLWKTSEIIEVAISQGYSERTIKRAISKLTQSGKIEKIKQGNYRISTLCQNATCANPIPENSGTMAQTPKLPGFLK